MSCSHYYRCRKCEKTVSASLVDVVGRSFKVMAVKCNDCGEVSDSTIEQTFDWNNETVVTVPNCYECGSENVVKWDDKCPMCGDMMSDDGIALLWD